MTAREWNSDPVRLARRRAYAGFAITVLLAVFAGAIAPLSGSPSPLLVLAIVLGINALIVLVVASLALTISRRYPDVQSFALPNRIAGIAAIVVGILGLVFAFVTATDSIGGVLAVPACLMIAVATGAVVILSRANRTAIRAAVAS